MTYPLEGLWRPWLRGPLLTRAASAATQWAGRTLIASGSATVTVSTLAINSDSIIRWGVQAAANLSSGTAIRGFEVRSINPGASFIFSTADGIALARDSTLMWEVVRTS